MGFGKPTAIKADAGSRSGRAFGLGPGKALRLGGAVLGLLCLASCSGAPLPAAARRLWERLPLHGDFEGRLARMEAALSGAPAAELPADVGAGIDRAIALAAARADTMSDKLRVLKRCLSAGAGYAARAADLLLGEPAVTPPEPLGSLAAYAFLRGGLPERAFALLEAAGPSADPGLWSEAFLATRGEHLGGALAAGAVGEAGKVGEAGEASAAGEAGAQGHLADSEAARGEPSSWSRVAAELERPDYLLVAALRAGEAGDSFAARSFAKAALDKGAEPPPAMLAALGLHEELLARLSSPSRSGAADAAELELAGDSAWSLGLADRAREYWRRSAQAAPGIGYRPWAKLALSARDDEAAWAHLGSAYPAEPAALRLRALRAAALGRAKDAAALAEEIPGSEALSLALRGPSMPEGRYAAELMALASTEAAPGGEGEAARARAAALRLLAERGRHEDFLELRDSYAARELDVESAWLWSAMAAFLEGDFETAMGLLEREGAKAGGFEAPYALGLSYAAEGRDDLAVARFEAALGALAAGPRPAAPPALAGLLADGDGVPREAVLRAAALKGLGASLARLGRAEEARKIFQAAAQADPSDQEAAFLSSNPGRASP